MRIHVAGLGFSQLSERRSISAVSYRLRELEEYDSAHSSPGNGTEPLGSFMPADVDFNAAAHLTEWTRSEVESQARETA